MVRRMSLEKFSPATLKKLITFRGVLQYSICVNNCGRHVVHRQPLRHCLTTDAFVSLGFAQALTVHEDGLRFLNPLNSRELALQFAHALVGTAPFQPKAA